MLQVEYTITKVDDNNYTFSSGLQLQYTEEGGGHSFSRASHSNTMINKIWNWIKNIFKPEKQDPHLVLYEEVKKPNTL